MAAALHGSLDWRRSILLRTAEDFTSSLWWGRDAVARCRHVWTNEPLPNSLTRIPSELVPCAKELYKCVLAHCADASTKAMPHRQAAQDFARVLCEHSDVALRDEAFVQLIKHTNENPLHESERLAWGLLDILSRFGATPSPAFAPYVVAYVEAVAERRRDAIGVLARLVRSRLQRQVLSTGDGIPLGRRWPPCLHRVLELKKGALALHRVPAETTVLLPSGRNFLASGPPVRCFSALTPVSLSDAAAAGEMLMLPAGATLVVEPWETAADVINVLAAHLGMGTAVKYLALHVVNAAPAELLPRSLVENAAAGLEVPAAAAGAGAGASAAAAATRFTLPAHHSGITHALDGDIVVGRPLRADEYPCEALLAATAAGVPAVLMLRRCVWLPEPDVPAVMECAPLTQLSYHQVRRRWALRFTV